MVTRGLILGAAHGAWECLWAQGTKEAAGESEKDKENRTGKGRRERERGTWEWARWIG